jgi:hypothetical protein
LKAAYTSSFKPHTLVAYGLTCISSAPLKASYRSSLRPPTLVA